MVYEYELKKLVAERGLEPLIMAFQKCIWLAVRPIPDTLIALVSLCPSFYKDWSIIIP